MDFSSSVSSSPEKAATPSQPSLTKKGLALQDESGKPSPSETEKVATKQTATPPQTPSENTIDVTV